MKPVRTGKNPRRATADSRAPLATTRRQITALVVASLCFLAPLLLLPYAQATQSQSWQPLGLRGEAVLALHITNYNGQRLIYAETHTGLWRFAPGMNLSVKPWRAIGGLLPRSRLGAPELAAWRVVPGRPHQIYALTGTGTARQLFRSTNAGDTWQIIGPAPGQTARPPMIVLPGPGDTPDTVTLVTDSRVQRSGDGGATWSPGGPWPRQEDDQETPSPRVGTLLADDSAPDRLFALTDDGQFWHSESGGLGWHTYETAALARPVSAVAIAPHFDLEIWAATRVDLLHSSDGGATWDAFAPPSPSLAAPTGAGRSQITAMLVDPQAPETLYAASAAGVIFRSDDGGDTWESLDAAGGARVSSLAIDPNTRDLLYVATNDGVWARPVTPPPPQPLISGTPGPDTLDAQADEIGFGDPTASPVVAPTALATTTPTALPTNTDTPEPTATAMLSPSPVPSPTAPPTAAATAVATAVATAAATDTPLPPTPAPPTLTPAPAPTSAPPARPRPTDVVPTRPAPTDPPPPKSTATTVPPR